MTLDQLKTRVKIKVDEYTPSGVSHAFDDYLEPMLKEAADELSDKAPKYLLDPVALPTGAIKYADDLAYIPKPSDFSRLYEVKFSLWDKPVYKALSPEHPDYARQDNEYLKAGYGRPVVMIKPYTPPSGTLAIYLVCGKVASSTLPGYAMYVQYKDPADMPDVLDEALTWLAASKIFQILEYPDSSKLAYNNHIIELNNKAR